MHDQQSRCAPVDQLSGSLFVLWQSLVVDSYRGFFVKLAAATQLRLALAAPTQFRELAQQLITCAPFKPPFHAGDARLPYFILKAWQPHVQVVLFKGLRRAMKAFFAPNGKPSSGPHLVLCMAEPYSLTALACWCSSRLALGPHAKFLLFGLQNIVKDLPLPLRLIQKFLFSKCTAILSLGQEQTTVLRQHGYSGNIIDFPLWFDAEQFSPGVTLANPLPTLGYAGGLTAAKGVQDLLQCLDANATRWAQRCAVRIAGAGALAGQVEAACIRLRAQGLDITCSGPLASEQMPDFFRGIDLLIVPSRTMPHWKEQFGRVIVEARGTGAIAIGSDSGEIPRVVGSHDRIFKEGDLAAMAQVIDLWLERLHSPVSRPALRAAETESALATYSDTALAMRFAGQLQLLITAQRGS